MKARIRSTGAEVEVREGESLLSALKRSGNYLVASCGGRGDGRRPHNVQGG